jgi:hypothetical protein
VDLRNVARPDDVLLLADVDALPRHLRALGRPEVDAGRKGRVDRNVFLRPLDERQHVGVLARRLRPGLRVLDHLLDRFIVELAGVAGCALRPEIHGGGDLLVELHHVGRDGGVGEPRRRPLATGELDLDGVHAVGFRHGEDLVGERLDLLA